MKPCPASIPQLVDKTIWLVARGCSPTVSSVDADVQHSRCSAARFVACLLLGVPRSKALCLTSLVNQPFTKSLTKSCAAFTSFSCTSWLACYWACHEVRLYALPRLSTGRKTLGERRCGNAEPENKTLNSEDDAGERSERVSY